MSAVSLIHLEPNVVPKVSLTPPALTSSELNVSVCLVHRSEQSIAGQVRTVHNDSLIQANLLLPLQVLHQLPKSPL